MSSQASSYKQSTVKKLLEYIAKECKVPLEDIEDAYPCSPFQTSCIIFGMSIPEGVLNPLIGQFVFDIAPNVDIDVLKSAWEQTKQDNPILRTRMVLVKDEPVQCVIRERKISWEEGDNLEEYKRNTRGKMSYGGPLLRQALVTERGARYLIITMHHGIHDGCSFLTTIDDLYAKLERKDRMPRPKYAGYIKAIVEESTVQAAADFFKHKLAGATITHLRESKVDESTHLPFTSGFYSRKFPMHSKHQLYTFASRVGTAWAFVLAHHSGKNDVVISYVSNGRDVSLHPQIGDINGPIMSSGPLRLQFSSTERVSEVLRRTAEEQNALNPWIQYAGQGWQNVTGIPPSAVSSWLLIQPKEFSGEEAEGRLLRVHKEDTGSHPFALSLQCFAGEDDECEVEIKWDERAFNKEDVENLVDEWMRNMNLIATQDCEEILVSELLKD